MDKKNKEKHKVFITILIISLILSNGVIWKIISLIRPSYNYFAYQLGAASFFLFFSIMVTRDNEHFSQYWIQHPKQEKVINSLIHFCIKLIYYIPMFCFVFAEGVGGHFSKKYFEEDKKVIEAKVAKIDSEPIISKIIVIPSTIMVAWVIIIPFIDNKEAFCNWASDISSLLISLIAFPFMSISVKEYIEESEKNNTKDNKSSSEN